MSNKKKPVRVLDLVAKHGTELDKAYESGKDIRTLSVEYKCSHNTMMIAIGVRGYEVEPWAREFVKKKLDAIEKDRLKRIKLKQPLLELP